MIYLYKKKKHLILICLLFLIMCIKNIYVEIQRNYNVEVGNNGAESDPLEGLTIEIFSDIFG